MGPHSGKTEGEHDEHAKLIRFRIETQPGINGGPPSFAIDDRSVISWQFAHSLVQALSTRDSALRLSINARSKGWPSESINPRMESRVAS